MRRDLVRKARKFLTKHVLHTDHTPHQVALGVFIGVLVSFLPLPAMQTVVAIGLAALLRANTAVCFPLVWITNPLTGVPIYTSCYVVGRFVLGRSVGNGHDHISKVIAQLFTEPKGGNSGLMRFVTADFWSQFAKFAAELGVETWVGAFVLGTICGLVGYALARWGVVAYRERHRHRSLSKSLARARLGRRSVSGTSPS